MVRFLPLVSVLLYVVVQPGHSRRHNINSELFHKLVKSLGDSPDENVEQSEFGDSDGDESNTFEGDESPRDENRLSEGLDGSPVDEDFPPMQDDTPEHTEFEDTPTSPDHAEDLAPEGEDEQIHEEDSSQITEEDSEGKMITITGFPEHVPGTENLRDALNGVYYESLCKVQGHPTYWKEKSDELKDGETPFLYWCGTNSTTKLIHKKWSIISANAYGKVEAGSCITFAPFPEKEEELKEGLQVHSVYKGWHDGKDLGFTTDADDWVKNVKIEKVEKMDRPKVDCQDLL
jgi:hypothetical protein